MGVGGGVGWVWVGEWSLGESVGWAVRCNSAIVAMDCASADPTILSIPQPTRLVPLPCLPQVPDGAPPRLAQVLGQADPERGGET